MTTLATASNNNSPDLIQRMIGDMRIRHLSPDTIRCYSRHVKKFAEFLNRSLDQATAEDIRSFQLHLIQIRKLSWSSFNQAVSSLRFFYTVTLAKPWLVTMIPFGKKSKRLPTVLSREEVEALLKCTQNPQTSYGSNDPVCHRTEDQRSAQPQDRRHRQPPHAIESHSWKGKPDAHGPRLTKTADRASRVLAGLPANDFSLFRTELQLALRGERDPRSHQGFGSQGQDHQACYTPCDASFLRDRSTGSRGGHSDDQSLAGPRQLYDHDDLPSRPTASLTVDPQSPGLAARQAASHLAAAEPNAEPTPELATAQSPAKLTVAQILTRSAAAYVAQYPRQAVPQVQSTLAKLSLCRTAALGERYLACVQCDYECMVYNSCGDRHCPQCSGAKRGNWLDASHKLILAGVDHYQVVFTRPSQLSRLALGNRRQLYKLLFRAAWLAAQGDDRSRARFRPSRADGLAYLESAVGSSCARTCRSPWRRSIACGWSVEAGHRTRW